MEMLLDLLDKLYQAFLYQDRWRLYLDGLGVTVSITLGAICISTVLGMVLCLMKLSRYKILRWPAQAYIDIIRGIPVVVQLLIMYNVVLLNVTDNKMVVAIVAFGLNSSAYMAEIYRSGINAVDPGQMEPAAPWVSPRPRPCGTSFSLRPSRTACPPIPANSSCW